LGPVAVGVANAFSGLEFETQNKHNETNDLGVIG